MRIDSAYTTIRRLMVSQSEQSMEDSGFANPFYLELSRYAVRFARAVYLGEPPPFSPSAYMRSATMTLLRFDNLFIGVTCQHVLARYRRRE